MRLLTPVPVERAVDATPPDRDRVVDAARAFSLIVVVAGHGLMAVVAWPGGVPRLGNPLAAFPWTQALTWILQIMPLFFFAGGAANALSWDRHTARGGDYATWIWARTARLLRPTWVYLAVMALIATAVTVLAPQLVAEPLMLLTTQLLWFLGAYLLVCALTPLMRRPASPASAVLVTIGLLTACGLVDLARFAADAPDALGLVNFVLVWAIPGYLGTLRSRGTLGQRSRKQLLAVAAAGLGLNAVLIHEGPWPVSMVGMPGEPVSNMAPPTVILAIHSIVLVALLTCFDGPLHRMLARRNVWATVTWGNLVAMSLYLWHLPVLIGLTTVGHALHLDRPVALDSSGFPVPDGWGYGLGSLLFLVLYALGVWLVVRIVWSFEHQPLPWWDSAPRVAPPPPGVNAVIAAVGVAGIGIATLVLSATGLAGFPTRVIEYAGLPLNAAAAIGVLAVSAAAVRYAGAPRNTTPPGGITSNPPGVTGWHRNQQKDRPW